MNLYSHLLEQALLPAYDTIRRRKHSAHRAFVEDSQWWPERKLREFQWAELEKLLRHAFTHVPYYREKYAAAGIRLEEIRSLDDFRRLPPLSREEVNAHRESLRSAIASGPLIESATGGSSGVPTRFYLSRESYDWRTAVSERAYSWTGCRVGDRTLYLWGAPIGDVSLKASWKMRVFRAVRREAIFNTFSQSEELWDRVWRRASEWQPGLLVGYVSSLEAFSRYLRDTGRTVGGIKAVIAAAEPVYAATRELVESAIGAPLFNTYGSREFMSLAGECERHDGLHINAENVLLESEGEAADGVAPVLVTDLHNLGMPFIRYRIGDLATFDSRPCGCGRGLPRIRSIEGRVLDALRTAEGRVVPGEFIPHLMKDIREVREFQARQDAPDSITLSIVYDGALSERSRSLLASEIAKVFGAATTVRIERVLEIPRLKSGKRRVTIGLPPA